MPKPYSRREILKEMSAFAKPNTRKGLALFALDYALFWGSIAGVLFLPSLWMKIAASALTSIAMGKLLALAHEAAHNSLTANRKLNWIIAVLCFAPCLNNYRLWVYDHHSLHHARTNGADPATYRPLSKAQYDALSPLRQRWERFIRAATPFGFGLYYITQRWSRVEFIPGAFLPTKLRSSAWKHFAFLCAHLGALALALSLAPLYANASAATALTLGIFVPFFLFQTMTGATLYLQHNHPLLPWFDNEAQRRALGSPEAVSFHLRMPKAIAWMIHHLYEHPAHHVQSGIPCYELWAAQKRLNEMLGDAARVEDASLGRIAANMRLCKLYDFEKRQWLDFDGRPTTEPLAQSAPA